MANDPSDAAKADVRRIVEPITQVEIDVLSGETDAAALQRYRSAHPLPSELRRPFLLLPADTGRPSKVRKKRMLFWPHSYAGNVVAFGSIFGVGMALMQIGAHTPEPYPFVGAGIVPCLIGGMGFVALLLYRTFIWPFSRAVRRPTPHVTTIGSPKTDWRHAEIATAEWLRAQGVIDAQPTRHTRDGGEDVTSARYAAQTKHWKANVGARDIREIFGVASAGRKQAMVFTRTGYTRDALEFAEDAGVALFVYSEDWEVTAASSSAKQLLATGF